jgi:hypothetical protein
MVKIFATEIRSGDRFEITDLYWFEENFVHWFHEDPEFLNTYDFEIVVNGVSVYKTPNIA